MKDKRTDRIVESALQQAGVLPAPPTTQGLRYNGRCIVPGSKDAPVRFCSEFDSYALWVGELDDIVAFNKGVFATNDQTLIECLRRDIAFGGAPNQQNEGKINAGFWEGRLPKPVSDRIEKYKSELTREKGFHEPDPSTYAAVAAV